MRVEREYFNDVGEYKACNEYAEKIKGKLCVVTKSHNRYRKGEIVTVTGTNYTGHMSVKEFNGRNCIFWKFVKLIDDEWLNIKI